MKTAIAILATCSPPQYDFRPGLEVLLFSLRKHNGELPAIVLITDEIDSWPGVERIIRVNRSDYSGVNCGLNRFKQAHWKYEAFGLSEYDRVVYMDADLLCLGDIAYLIYGGNYDFGAAPDSGGARTCRQYHTWNLYNTGLMVLSGDMLKSREALIKLASGNFKSLDGGDMGIINEYIWRMKPKHVELPADYNCLKRRYHFRRHEWDRMRPNLRLLHYVGKKPWQGGEKGYEELDELWHKYQAEMLGLTMHGQRKRVKMRRGGCR